MQSKLPAVRAILAFVLAACAAAPTQTVQIATKPQDAGSPDADAAVVIAADDASPEAASPVTRKTVSEPWCSERYDVVPCVFRAYGLCFLRDRELPKPEDGYAYWSCPADPAPAFMTKTRACGRRPNEAVVSRQVSYAIADKAKCSAIETRWANVLSDERACKSNDDCAAINDGCFHAALNKTAATLPKYADRPCGNPAAGMCAPRKNSVRCESGCCLFDGSTPFGTIEPAYPKITPP
jgi:hypothetical protein